MNPKANILINTDKRFSKFGKNFQHFETAKLSYPTEEQLQNLFLKEYEWKFGDRLETVSRREYGDRRYWRIIAFFNMKPTDFHCKPGDILEIPFPLERAMDIMGF